MFPEFRTKMCIKVKCFTKVESKCLITNNKKRGPETVFCPGKGDNLCRVRENGKNAEKRLISHVIFRIQQYKFKKTSI